MALLARPWLWDHLDLWGPWYHRDRVGRRARLGYRDTKALMGYRGRWDREGQMEARGHKGHAESLVSTAERAAKDLQE